MPTAPQMEESDLDLIVAGTARRRHHDRGLRPRDARSRRWPTRSSTPTSSRQSSSTRSSELRAEGRPAGRRCCPPPCPTNPLADELYKKYGAEFTERYLTEGQAGPQRRARRAQGQDHDGVPARGRGRAEVHRRRRCRRRIGALRERIFRELTLDGTRIDGRAPKELRAISCEVGVLPRTHGSALFQRGETQALVAATLGTVADEQKVDGLQRRVLEEVHARLQLPAVLGRRVQADPRPRPPRDRPRHARRAVAQGGHPAADASSRTRSASSPTSSSRTARRSMASRLRRHAGADGRRRADQAAGRRHLDRPRQGRRQVHRC